MVGVWGLVDLAVGFGLGLGWLGFVLVLFVVWVWVGGCVLGFG